MLKGFRDFILRGNVIDLAVAVIIGAAFSAITKSLVEDIISPLIAAVAGKPDFSAIVFTVNNTPIKIGNFVNGQSLADDLVFWYRTGALHPGGDLDHCHVVGPTLVPIGDWSP